MGKAIDLTGQVFGKLTVIERDWSKTSRPYWLCRCSCGNPNLKSILGASLTTEHTKTCGKCQQFEMIGKTFGRLTVLDIDLEYPKIHKLKNTDIYYKCQCSCNNGTIVSINGNNLKRNLVRSCGCLRKEVGSQLFTKDLTGQVFGFLEVLEKTDKRTSGNVIWKCKCLRDGNIVEVASGHLIQGHTKSCGCCNSFGEANIQKILQENNVVFEREKSFDDLRGERNNKYRYDFYLPEYNRLVEFDGEQHYIYLDAGWSTKEYLEKTQENDKTKNEYALSNNIYLVRIPYTERDNITLELLLGDQYLITKEKVKQEC